MTHLEVHTRGGQTYVKDLKYESTQEACDVVFHLVRLGYSVIMRIDAPVPANALQKIS